VGMTVTALLEGIYMVGLYEAFNFNNPVIIA
jgi:hypothetical protein